jgi:hypothetical protein
MYKNNTIDSRYITKWNFREFLIILPIFYMGLKNQGKPDNYRIGTILIQKLQDLLKWFYLKWLHLNFSVQKNYVKFEGQRVHLLFIWKL